jgi:serine/threonine protein kinase
MTPDTFSPLEYLSPSLITSFFNDPRMITGLQQPISALHTHLTESVFSQSSVPTASNRCCTLVQAAKYVVLPFLSTLAHLHASGIIHRDIKPENILVTESGSLQLADFGLSIRSESDAPVTRVGTLDYMAPEVVNCPRKRNPQDWKDRTDLHYTAAVDVWALGVLVYELCLGEPPFSGVRRFSPVLYARTMFQNRHILLSPDGLLTSRSALRTRSHMKECVDKLQEQAN